LKGRNLIKQKKNSLPRNYNFLLRNKEKIEVQPRNKNVLPRDRILAIKKKRFCQRSKRLTKKS
jgi:hypothetical protein